jgi:hypothetical protein
MRNDVQFVPAQDTRFTHRRSVKYEEVYLKDYRDGWEAESSLAAYFTFYCHGRRF